MRYFPVFASIFLLILSCKENVDLSKSDECIPYFDFDEVEYYHIDFSNDDYHNLVFKQRTNREENEALFLNIFSVFFPKGEIDSLNIGNLRSLGYKKSKIPESIFSELNKIFCERNHEFSESSACGYYNRDILIFKKNGNNIGIAKLCFECELSQIIGSKRNTQDFGQSEDFKVLKELLNKYRKK